MSTRDTIRIEHLAVHAEVGVYARERGVRRPILIDIALETNFRDAARTDALEFTVDYDRAAAIAREVATSNHHALIEKLADELAGRLLRELVGIERAFVRVAKPGAVPDAENVSVEVWRSRSTESGVP